MWTVCDMGSLPAASRLARVVAVLPPRVRAEFIARGLPVLAALADFPDLTGEVRLCDAGAGLVIYRASSDDIVRPQIFDQSETLRYLVVILATMAPSASAVAPTIGQSFVLASTAYLPPGTDDGALPEPVDIVLIYQRLPDRGQLAPEVRGLIHEASEARARQISVALTLRHASQPGRPDDLATALAAQIERLEDDRERIRQHNESLQQTLSAILGSFSWRTLRQVRGLVARLRGEAYIEPTMPKMLQRLHAAIPQAPEGTEGVAPSHRVSGQPLVVMLLENFDFGGLEKVVLDLSIRMTGQGRQLIILVVGYDGKLAEQARAAGITVLGFGGDAAALEATILDLKPEVAFCHHSYSGWNAFAACGTRIIEVMQNIYHWQRGSAVLTDLRKTAWRVIVCSRAVQLYAVDFLDVSPEKLVLVHNGIDPSGLIRPDQDALRQIRRALPGTIYILTSHIWANKCHHTALSAFKAVHARFPQTRLIFDGSVGHADVAEALTQRIKAEGLDAVVDMINSRSRQEISRIYERAHAFILPSIVEGLSIATLEAAYFGLPLILSDTGGARDVLEQADGTTPFGIIVPPPVAMGSVTPEAVDRVGRMERPPHLDHVIDAMMQIAGDRDGWIDRGLSGIARSEAFTIDHTVQKYDDLIEVALQDRRCEV